MTTGALWIYQAARFPLSKTAPLLAVFSAASLYVSAVPAGQPLPSWGAFLTAFVVAMTLFFQMRVCDEVKDWTMTATFALVGRSRAGWSRCG